MSISLLCCSGSLEGGGSERQLWQLACHLPRPKFKLAVYLLTAKGIFLGQLPADITLDDFWSPNKLGASRLRLPGSIHLAQVRHLAKVIRGRQIHVVYDRTFHMTLVTAPACRAAGVKRVSVIVSPPSQDFVRAGESFAWLKKRRLRAAYSDPGSITVAVSSAVADDAAEFYRIEREKIVVIPSPIDLKSVHEKAFPAGKQPTQDSATFCVVGRLSPEKGQKLALDAFVQVADLHPRATLNFIGNGPDLERLKAFARTQGIEGRVNFLGFQENPYPAIASATAVVIPSEYEGLPNVALESMALRCPVIATRCSGSVVELLGEGARGQLVERGDSVALAKAMKHVLGGTDSEQLDAAESWVRENHSLPCWVRRMESLFEEMCPNPRGVA